MNLNKDALTALIRQTSTIPPLDLSTKTLLDLLQQPDLYPEQVFNTVNTDPVLASKLLQVANSAAYRRQNPVESLKAAITLLGVDLSMSIAFSCALQSACVRKSASGFNQLRFWRKGVIAAWLALNMKQATTKVRPEQLYLACLLQDIGIYVFSHVLGDKYNQLYSAAKCHRDLISLEQRSIGCDHATAGAILLAQWGIPNTLVDAVANSHHLILSKPVEPLSPGYWVALIGMEADFWLMDIDNAQTQRLEQSLHAHEALQVDCDRALASISTAGLIFNMTLLESTRVMELQAYKKASQSE